MYLQVVHYYDPRAQTPAATVHALVLEGSTENPVREKPMCVCIHRSVEKPCPVHCQHDVWVDMNLLQQILM